MYILAGRHFKAVTVSFPVLQLMGLPYLGNHTIINNMVLNENYYNCVEKERKPGIAEILTGPSRV